jgi:predicted MFS family arabinose efflux permease
MTGADITHADLAEHYRQTCLARLGMSLDEALAIPTIATTLTRAVQEQRRQAARHAGRLYIHENQQREAA